MQILGFNYNEVHGNVIIENIIKYSSKIKYKDDEKMSETMEKNILRQELYLYGKHDGVSEGINQKEKDVVLEMYKDNIAIDTIAKYVKLTVSKVKETINANTVSENICN